LCASPGFRKIVSIITASDAPGVSLIEQDASIKYHRPFHLVDTEVDTNAIKSLTQLGVLNPLSSLRGQHPQVFNQPSTLDLSTSVLSPKINRL